MLALALLGACSDGEPAEADRGLLLLAPAMAGTIAITDVEAHRGGEGYPGLLAANRNITVTAGQFGLDLEAIDSAIVIIMAGADNVVLSGAIDGAALRAELEAQGYAVETFAGVSLWSGAGAFPFVAQIDERRAGFFFSREHAEEIVAVATGFRAPIDPEGDLVAVLDRMVAARGDALSITASNRCRAPGCLSIGLAENPDGPGALAIHFVFRFLSAVEAADFADVITTDPTALAGTPEIRGLVVERDADLVDVTFAIDIADWNAE